MRGRLRQHVVEETEALREMGYRDADIWPILGYRWEESWRRALRRFEQQGPAGPGPVPEHGRYTLAIRQHCPCEPCTARKQRERERIR